MTCLAGLVWPVAKGEVEITTFSLFCLGFLASRLLRRCFWDIWDSFRPDAPARGTSALRATLGSFGHRVRFVLVCDALLPRRDGVGVDSQAGLAVRYDRRKNYPKATAQPEQPVPNARAPI